LQARKAKVGWVLRSLLEWESGFLSILFFKFIFQKQNRYRPNSKVKNGVKKKMYPDQAILSQSIAKRSCRNQLPNDPVAINCQTILSQSIAKRSCQNKLSRENVGTKNVFSSLNNATRFCAPIGIAPLNYGGLKAKSGGQFPNIIKLAKLAWQQNLILF
jgi:hypothetical protein